LNCDSGHGGKKSGTANEREWTPMDEWDKAMRFFYQFALIGVHSRLPVF